ICEICEILVSVFFSALQRYCILFFWQVSSSCCKRGDIRVAKHQRGAHDPLAIAGDAVIARAADLSNQTMGPQEPQSSCDLSRLTPRLALILRRRGVLQALAQISVGEAFEEELSA